MGLHPLAVFPDAALVLPWRELLENLVEEWDVSMNWEMSWVVGMGDLGYFGWGKWGSRETKEEDGWCEEWGGGRYGIESGEGRKLCESK